MVLPIDNNATNSQPMKEFLSSTFGFEQSMLGVVVFMPILFTLLFAGVFAFAIKHLNFQQR